MNNEMIDKSIKALTEYSKQHGFPTVREWEKFAKEKGYLTSYQLIHRTKKFWYEIRDELGFKEDQAIRRKQKLKKEQQLAICHLQEAAKALGENFTKRQYADFAKVNGYYSIGQLVRLFQGKFNNAKLAAGLPIFIAEDKFSDDDIVKAIKACSVFYNHRKFSESEYMEWREQEKVNRPHTETIRKRLGFLPEVKTMLNMETYEIHAVTNSELTKEYCLSVVRKFISEMLSNENYIKWAKKNNMPAYSTILSKTKMTWEDLKQLR